MIRTELFEKNSVAHCFIFSATNPNILIPVKVFIKDVKFYESNPKYLVKVMKFYDNIHFLKKNFIGQSFQTKFDVRARNLTFVEDFKSSDKLQEYMYHIDRGDRFYLVVESINMVKYKKELEDLFNKLQDFLIMKSIKDFRNASVRHLYSGKFKLPSKTEFHARLKTMIGDKVAMTAEDYERFVDLLS